jgi:hypothetical protein
MQGLFATVRFATGNQPINYYNFELLIYIAVYACLCLLNSSLFFFLTTT